MTLRNGLAEAVRERVEHAVVWMNGGQTVLVQLVSHDAHKLLHSLVVIRPVTHNLKERVKQHILNNELFLTNFKTARIC